MLILPMNINTKQVVKSTAAVEKLAGRINPHTKIIGIMMGTKADLKSFI
jgi:hypothetical protein